MGDPSSRRTELAIPAPSTAIVRHPRSPRPLRCASPTDRPLNLPTSVHLAVGQKHATDYEGPGPPPQSKVRLVSIMGSTSSTHDAAWPGLELRHLLALVAVADAGTFSGAAETLDYTQSAVSQQIANLERIVGTPLFERPGGPRPVRLTAAGEMLLAHARGLLASVVAAATDLRALASGETGELRVGTLPSIGNKVISRVLGTFRADWPASRSSYVSRVTCPSDRCCRERRSRRNLHRDRQTRNGALGGPCPAR